MKNFIILLAVSLLGIIKLNAQTIPYPLVFPDGWTITNTVSDEPNEKHTNIIIQDINNDGINDVVVFLKKYGNNHITSTMAFISDKKLKIYKPVKIINYKSDYLEGSGKSVTLGVNESSGRVFEWNGSKFSEVIYDEGY